MITRRATVPLLALPLLALPSLAHAAPLPDGYTQARTGRGKPARWELVPDPTAQGGQALAQLEADPTDYRYPLLIWPAPAAADVEISIRFKAVAGRTDRAGGIAIRLTDPDNYIVLRANALEDNVNLYRVVRGDRREIKGATTRVTSGEWHTLGVRAVGDAFTATFDGKVLFTVSDRSIPGPGRVALWTKADSVTHFDTLTLRAPP